MNEDELITNNTINTNVPNILSSRHRKVLPSASEARGRSIVQILYDRSIYGPNGIGKRQNQSHDHNVIDNADVQDDRNLTSISPSSVIIDSSERSESFDIDDPDGEQHNDGDNEQRQQQRIIEKDTAGTMEVDLHTQNRSNHDNDSLSEVLNSDNNENENDATDTDTKQNHRHTSSIDSLSDILTTNITNQTQNQSLPSMTKQEDQQHKKIPPRLKMNSYPMNHFTEIKNYAELYSVTKFNWNYLSLKSKTDGERRQNIRPRPDENAHNDNINSDSEIDDGDTDTPISTISIAFSPDGRTVASTHGDHTVKITCCNTGALIRNLVGHQRTPWTVKYHPTKSNIVASGELSGQIRVWDWNYRSNVSSAGTGTLQQEPQNDDNDEDRFNYHNRQWICINTIKLNSAIVSLDFHPTGTLLAIASGHSLHLWVYDDDARKEYERQQQDEQNASQISKTQQLQEATQESQILNDDNQIVMNHIDNERTSPRRERRTNSNSNDSNARVPAGASSILTQIRYEHSLRCVHFPPGGDTIIVGATNSSRQQSGDASYSLRLWDFDLEVALNPHKFLGREGELIPTEKGVRDHNGRPVRRDALTNFRTFIPRALLYNDGGFDVSPDGKKLCGCAEIFLPWGVSSAMTLIEAREEKTWKDQNNIKDDDKVIKNKILASSNNCDDVKNDIIPSNTTTRSPRRRIDIPRVDKDEKRRKEGSGASRAVENSNEEKNDEAQSPLEQPSHSLGGCRTPPNPIRPQTLTSPPSPPGRRWSLNFNRSNRDMHDYGPGSYRRSHYGGYHPSQNHSTDGPPPPPLPPYSRQNREGMRLPSELGVNESNPGRYVPHVVVINLDKSGRLGQLLEASPLGSRASSVTCVKFSPSTEFCLLGYGVRDHVAQHQGEQYHPVTSLYRIRGGMTQVATMLSKHDDVNIARFHPHSGHGFAYGTKQGRVRVLSPRAWNEYYE